MTRTYIATVALLSAFATTAIAQGTSGLARVPVAPDSKLWIDGTSNLHSWSCKAQKLDASVEMDAASATVVSAAPLKAFKRVDVKVPVKALKCGHGAMDDNLYKALKADDTPDISYILATFDVVEGATKDTFTLNTVGKLTIAGKENNINMSVTGTRLPDGTIKAVGVVPVKMTDFGIKPPTAIFGRLKTGDEVKVNFELTMGPKAIAAALGQP